MPTPIDSESDEKMRYASWIIALAIALGVTAYFGSYFLENGIVTQQHADDGTDLHDYATGDADTAPEDGGDAADDAAAVIPSVRVSTISAQPVDNKIILQARTEADRTVTLRAEQNGLIAEVLVSDGDRVTEGQVLARIETRDREAALAEANATLAQMELEYSQAVQLNSRGFRATTDVRIKEASLEAARAGVERAQIALDQLIVTAPFSGILDDVVVEIGDLVSSGDPVADLVDIDPIVVVGQVSERTLGHIEYGSLAEIHTLDGRNLMGIVSFVGSVADPVTRAYPVKVELADTDHGLIAGVTAELVLPLGSRDGHLISPAILSLAEDGTIGVKTVDENSSVVFLPVQLLGDTTEGIWVGGLPHTITVITVGQEFVKPGQEVQAVDEASIEGDAA